MKKSLMIACAALCLVAANPAGVYAQSAIKVVVDDQAITSFQIGQRARLISLTERKSGAAATKAAQDELIDEVLKLKEAKRYGITVSKKQVDDAFATIASRVKLTPANLAAALRQSGVDPETLRDRLRTEIAWSQILRQRFQGRVSVSESDIAAQLQKLKSGKDEPLKSIEYRLEQVIFVVPEKASGGFKAQRKKEAEQLRKSFTTCEQSSDQVRAYSEVVVKTVGFRLETELPADMKDVIAKTAVGQLTPPQVTPRGLEMIAVCGKRELTSDVAARTEIEDELRQKEGEQLTRRYIQDLRRQSVISYR
ncbi:peptidylprolyl isomerase [Pannonibacter phragmitetus]|nr:peptidylprolyl isomerase [Pannonibacter phragmitetus]